MASNDNGPSTDLPISPASARPSNDNAHPPGDRVISQVPIPSSRRNDGDRSLPRATRGDVWKAAHETWVKPFTQQFTSGFDQMNPVNMAKNWAEANPVSRSIMDFKHRLDHNRKERDEPGRRNSDGFVNRRFSAPAPERAGANMGGGGGDASSLRQPLTSGFGQVVQELRALRSVTSSLASSASTTAQNTKTIAGSLEKLTAEIKKGFSAKDAGREEEKQLEANGGQGLASATGTKDKLFNGILGFMLDLLATAGAQFKKIATAFGEFTKFVIDGIGSLGTKILEFFKGIKLPKFLEEPAEFVGKIFGRVGEFFESVGKFVEPLLKFAEPLVKLAEPLLALVRPLLGFAKVIPGLGEIIIVVMTVIDGLVGFFKGFTETKGNFMQKLLGGFEGAAKNIVDGLIAPFKWLGGLLMDGVKLIAKALGLDKFIDQIKKIDFGQIFAKVVNMFVPDANMFKMLWDAIVQLFTGLTTKVAQGAADLAGNVGAAASAAGQAAAGVARDVGDGVRHVAHDLSQGARTVAEKLADKNDITVEKEGVAAGSVVNSGAGFTTVKLADGSTVSRHGTVSWRANNPGDLDYGEFAQKHGAVGWTKGPNGHKVAVFATAKAGEDAQKALLVGKYGNSSIAETISKWAPPNENDTAGYIRRVTQGAGVSADTKINQLTPDQLAKVMSTIKHVEGGDKVGKTYAVASLDGKPVDKPDTSGKPKTGAQAAQMGKGQADLAKKTGHTTVVAPTTNIQAPTTVNHGGNGNKPHPPAVKHDRGMLDWLHWF
jgi:hypothetical protein